MIQLIVGPKGTGKTKRIIALANAEMIEDKGSVVFIDDDKRYMYDVNSRVRFVNVSDYDIDSYKSLYGFLCGMLSQNFDITSIYIDAFLHIIGKKVDELDEFFAAIEKISEENKVKFVFNVSAEADAVPEYLQKYII